MHSGTAEGGHYFSFINTNEDTWCEFNDSIVKEFDAKDLKKECFGGSTNNVNFYYYNLFFDINIFNKLPQIN